jgi:hypothetical protein
MAVKTARTMPKAAATLAGASFRWMPRPGSRVWSIPASGSSCASIPLAAPT